MVGSSVKLRGLWRVATYAMSYNLNAGSLIPSDWRLPITIISHQLISCSAKTYNFFLHFLFPEERISWKRTLRDSMHVTEGFTPRLVLLYSLNKGPKHMCIQTIVARNHKLTFSLLWRNYNTTKTKCTFYYSFHISLCNSAQLY